MSTDDSTRKLADSYAAFLKVNNLKEMNMLDESIEDTLTRLEELESGIKMLQAEREKFGSVDLSGARCGLNALCQRTLRLEEMSRRVLQDVEALEPVVDRAEADLLYSTEGRLKSLLKPLFHMKSDTSSSQSFGPSPIQPQFTAQPCFKTASFFPKSSDNQSESLDASFQ